MSICQFQPNNLQKPRTRCPKGTKVPKMVKIFAALGPHKNKEERNSYIRTMGTVTYEFQHRVKRAYSSNKTSDSATRATTEKEVDTTEI